MENMDEKDYLWAYTKIGEEDGPDMRIDDVTEENRKKYRFFCYGCDAELFPVLGKVRRHHFRHKKGEGHGCSFETYLHKTAKRLLKQRFDRDSNFSILVEAVNMCDMFDDCSFRKGLSESEQKGQWDMIPNKRIICNKHFQKKIDLKKFYDTCEIEKGYNGFIADVKLSNSQDDSIVPLFLEICVKHPCSPEKINSEIPIVEFYINGAEDLKPFESGKNYVIQEKEGSVKYYNFIFEDLTPFEDSEEEKYSWKRIEFYQSEGGLKQRDSIISCHDFGMIKHSDDSVADIVFFGGKSDLGFAVDCLLSLTGRMERHCAFCKYGKRVSMRSNPNDLRVQCAKNKYIKYPKKDIYGRNVEGRGRIVDFAYERLWGINCGDYEQDDEKLKKEVKNRNAIGWWKKESNE